MADCSSMKKGDVYVCTLCGLELMVSKPCACVVGSEDGCTVPLRCCGKDMVKKEE